MKDKSRSLGECDFVSWNFFKGIKTNERMQNISREWYNKHSKIAQQCQKLAGKEMWKNVK